ncbi:MAG: cytidine deaminase [Sphingomonas bacterium]|nr:cytidine deaminase [Sphingomonas bacterium]
MAEVAIEDVGIAVLVDAARVASRNAHAPYSRFAVGAALLLADGQIVTGANFENASYGLSLCAETVALATVNSSGRLADVVAVAVTGGAMGSAGGLGGGATGETVCRPCGRCRQILNEAAQIVGRDLPIYCAAPEGDAVEKHMLSALLPFAFGPADLGIGNKH